MLQSRLTVCSEGDLFGWQKVSKRYIQANENMGYSPCTQVGMPFQWCDELMSARSYRWTGSLEIPVPLCPREVSPLHLLSVLKEIHNFEMWSRYERQNGYPFRMEPYNVDKEQNVNLSDSLPCHGYMVCKDGVLAQGLFAQYEKLSHTMLPIANLNERMR